MISWLRKQLSSPFVTMWLVVVMYVTKSIIKITVGNQIHSPMIAGDGFHNLADIVEALAVLGVIYVARRPATSSYPFGRKNIEFFTSLAIGLVLLGLAVQFAVKSIVGLLSYAPDLDRLVRAILPLPDHEPLVMNSENFVWLLVITAGSAILSLIVSRYQIAVGKKSGHASLVADGEETASDGRIEMLALAGVLGEYFFHAPWLEYLLGIVVAGFILHTGWGLFRSGYRVLLQHSIGAEHEAEIKKRCLNVCGVHAVKDLKTFQVGQMAVCMLVVTTKHTADTVTYIKYGIEHHVRAYLLSSDFKECEIHIKFEKPEPERHRVAYAIVYSDRRFIKVAANLAEATHILVCDVELGMIVRTARETKPVDLATFVSKKRILTVYFFTGTLEVIPSTADNPVPQAVPAFLPRVNGLL